MENYMKLAEIKQIKEQYSKILSTIEEIQKQVECDSNNLSSSELGMDGFQSLCKIDSSLYSTICHLEDLIVEVEQRELELTNNIKNH